MMLAVYNEDSLFPLSGLDATADTVGSLTETLGSLSSCPIPVVATRVADDDADSVVSSLSSCDDDERCRIDEREEPSQPRSIFRSYWKQVDDGSLPSVRCHRSKPSPCPGSPRGVADNSRHFLSPLSMKLLVDEFDDPEASSSSYEQIIKHMESTDDSRRGGKGLFVSPYASRPLAATGRTWGGWWRASLPSFETVGFSGGVYSRTSKSESALNTRPSTLASCLRQSRFSFSHDDDADSNVRRELSSPVSSSSSRRPLVSFKQQVDIVKFDIPLENFAADGWSSWFDYRER